MSPCFVNCGRPMCREGCLRVREYEAQMTLGDEMEPPAPAAAVPELGQNAAAALAQTIIGFAAPGRYESGKKVPAKVQARAEELARASVKLVREAISAG